MGDSLEWGETHHESDLGRCGSFDRPVILPFALFVIFAVMN